MSRPSQSLKSSPMPNMSRLSSSTSTASLPNGTPHCLNQKHLPLSANRQKVQYEILCVGNKANKLVRETSNDPSPGSSKVTSVNVKPISDKPNTLVPYTDDSSESSEDGIQKEVASSKSTLNEVVQNIPLPSTSSSDNAEHNSQIPQNAPVMSKTEKSSTDGKVNSSGKLCDNEEERNRSLNLDLFDHKTMSSSPANLLDSSNVLYVQNLATNSTVPMNVIYKNLHSPSIASGSSTNSIGTTTDWEVSDQENALQKGSKQNYSGWNVLNMDKNEKDDCKEMPTFCQTSEHDEVVHESNCAAGSENLGSLQNHRKGKSDGYTKNVETVDSKSVETVNLSHSGTDSTEMIYSPIQKPFLAPSNEERTEETNAFRDYKSEKSFLVQSGDGKESSGETGVKKSLKRPYCKLQDDCDPRDSKFSDSCKDCEKTECSVEKGNLPDIPAEMSIVMWEQQAESDDEGSSHLHCTSSDDEGSFHLHYTSDDDDDEDPVSPPVIVIDD